MIRFICIALFLNICTISIFSCSSQRDQIKIIDLGNDLKNGIDGNLIKGWFNNLNFESELDTVKNWNLGGGIQCALDNEIFHEGQKSIKLTGTYTADAPGYVYQDIKPSNNQMTHYRISGYVRTEDVNDGLADIYVYTKIGMRWMAYESLATYEIDGSNDWALYEQDIRVQPGVTQLRLGVSLSGTGTAWFDDITVIELDNIECVLPDSIDVFMEECLDLVMEHSLYRDSINRADLKKDWLALSQCAVNTNEAGKDFGLVLKTVDNHSFYYSTEQVRQWQTSDLSDSDETAEPDIPLSRGERIGDYGYISMPLFSSGEVATQVFFADHMQNLIDSLDRPDLKGWILDLRENGGGNCWPMLAGIGPILGEGLCGYFQKGDNMQPWSYENGESKSSGKGVTKVSREPYIPFIENPRVAVLVGGGTGSSGEVVAIAFKNRPKTKIFGDRTAGYTTGNVNFPLSNKAMLFIASSVYVDREANPYPKYMKPDMFVMNDRNTEVDEVLEGAIEWLKSKDK